MATIVFSGTVPRTASTFQADYSAMREEVSRLETGDTFEATLSGRYSANCARKALAHFARRLGWQVSSRTRGSVMEITRDR